MCWSATVARCSHHCQLCGALITSSIRTPTPWREWAFGRTSMNPWCSLFPVSSTTSNGTSNAGVTVPSHLPHWMLPHPGLTSNHLHYRCQLRPSLTLRGPLGFIFFYMTVSAIAQQPSCTVFAVASTCAVLPAQLAGPVKLNPTSLATV